VVEHVVGPLKTLPAGERSLERGVEVNAHAQAQVLAAQDPIIRPAAEGDQIRVVAAVYDIESGRVSIIP
jgi:carbonic anhydrase